MRCNRNLTVVHASELCLGQVVLIFANSNDRSRPSLGDVSSDSSYDFVALVPMDMVAVTLLRRTRRIYLEILHRTGIMAARD